MDSLLRFFRKLSMLIGRRRYNSDLQEELAFHREQLEESFRAAGFDADEAHYAAQRQIGNDTAVADTSHDVVGFAFETVWQDFRYAARQLGKNPGFAATSILILALGIGASTAIFSAVNPVLFEPLPYPHPGRIMMIWESRSDGHPLDVTFATFHGFSERSRSFQALAVMKPWQPIMVGTGQPERFDGQQVTAAYLRALGIQPVLGRSFLDSDDRFHGPNVVILSDGLWRRRFAADPSIVGRQIRLDDDLYTVIGVMPASFENVPEPEAQIWAPLQYDPSLPSDGREFGHHLRMIGRLPPDVSRAQARSELNVILHTLAQLYAKGYDSSGGAPSGVIMNALQDDVTRGIKPALLAVLGAVILLLIIACVNVTNLLLARGIQRRGEFAMRAALGAARKRLLRQLVTESLLLASLGGVCGMVVAEFGVRALVALSPPGLPRINAIHIDATVFTFAIAITTLIGAVVGLIPAITVFHGGLQPGMQQASRRAAGSHDWTRNCLVIAEVSLALMLLVSAGLLLHSMRRLFSVDPGFDASHLLTMQVQESGRRFESDGARDRFFKNALEAVRRVPGVTSAAFTSQLPLSGDFDTYGVQFEAFPNDDSEAGFRYAVSPDYFATMHIPLLRGRLLNQNDRAGQPGAVLISESFAKRKFPDRDPIGQRVRSGPDMGHAERPWDIIVGVVGDVKQTSLAVNEPDAFYTTPAQWAWVDNVQSLVVRTTGDPASLVPAIRDAIWSVDRDVPVVRVATMENLLAISEAERRFALILFEAFALIALALAATGIYGVLAGSVNERIREIGIRSALGASPKNIVALVFRQGMMLAGIGVAIGLLGAAIASQALLSLLFGISRLDPLTYGGVIGLLVAIAAIACSIPAWRAAQVDPAITLRAE